MLLFAAILLASGCAARGGGLEVLRFCREPTWLPSVPAEAVATLWEALRTCVEAAEVVRGETRG